MKRIIVTILSVGVLLGASAQDTEQFAYFQSKGVFDPGVSAEAANSLVAKGIASGDSSILDLTLRGLGGLAALLAHDLPNPYGKPPTRSFQEVPGLKNFLIEYWRSQLEVTGGSSMQAALDYVGQQSTDGVFVDRSESSGGVGGQPVKSSAGFDEPFADAINRVPPWIMIPQILSVYWPKDPEVEQFLYDMRELDDSPTIVLATLLMLNAGNFTTESANAFRMQQLNYPSQGLTDHNEVTLAIQGLAMTAPTYALPSIIKAGKEYPQSWDAAVVALSSYDEFELRMYETEIDSLVHNRVGLLPMGATAEAVELLKSILDGSRITPESEPVLGKQ